MSADDEDAAAVIAVLLALTPADPAPVRTESRWGRPTGPTWETAPDAWWASGLPR